MNSAKTLIAEGRVWMFAEDNLNTDLMMPQTVFAKPLEIQLRSVFATYRPGWVDEVRPGDVIIGGRNFGTGSSRPASLLLKRLGVSALVAETINGLFYRNCVNYALPALECAGIRDFAREGDEIRVNFVTGRIENLARNDAIEVAPMPEFLRAIIQAGGIRERLKAEGYL